MAFSNIVTGGGLAALSQTDLQEEFKCPQKRKR